MKRGPACLKNAAVCIGLSLGSLAPPPAAADDVPPTAPIGLGGAPATPAPVVPDPIPALEPLPAQAPGENAEELNALLNPAEAQPTEPTAPQPAEPTAAADLPAPPAPALAPAGPALLAPAPETTPAVAEAPASPPQESAAAARDPRIPEFHLMRPRWAVEVTGSTRGIGRASTLPRQGGSNVRGFQVALEYQPAFLQALGVVSVGPMLSAYPVFENQDVTASKLGLWSYGFQARYQARWFREQPLVPMAGYEFERWNYSLTSGARGALNAQGPVLGAMFLMNVLEPRSAASFYANQGVLRTYLVAELRKLTAQDSQVSLSGNTYFFGLRFEF